MVQLAVPEIEDTYSSTNATTNTSVPNSVNIPNSNTKIAVPPMDKDAKDNPYDDTGQENADDKLSKQYDISAELTSTIDALFDRDHGKYWETYATADNINRIADNQEKWTNQKAAKKRVAEMMEDQGITQQQAYDIILNKADKESHLYILASGTDSFDIAADTIAENMPDFGAQKETIIKNLQSKNAITSGLTDWLLEEASKPNGMSMSALNTLVTSDQWLNPATMLLDVPILFAEAQEEWGEGNYGSSVMNYVLAGLNVLPAASVISKGIKSGKLLSKKMGVKRRTLGNYTVAEQAKINESKLALRAKANAARAASKYSTLKVQLIDEFEEANDVVISSIVKGNKVIDYDKVRSSGADITKKIYDDGFIKSFKEDIAGRADLDLSDLVNSSGDLISPILNPEKFDGLIAVVGKLKERVPEAFNNKKKLIDNLFDYTLTGDIKQTDALINDLSKYGLSFEDFILSVSGSASQAGKILNKVSQMKRTKSLTLKNVAKENRKLSSEEGIKKFWSSYVLRGENVRRGMMVSAFATAARNASSYGIRAPAETLVNIFEEAAWKFAQQNAKGKTMKGLAEAGQAINPFAKTGTYTDAFAEMKYIFRNPIEAKQTTDYILDRPELRDLQATLFGNIGELQALRGRGQGTNVVSKAVDKIYSAAEDTAWLVNTPNRFQEFMIRRGVFMGNLERAVKKEYGQDLNQLLRDGKIRDLLNDATTVRPEGARSIYSILDDSAQRALDVTYAKQPDFWAFRKTSDFITKSGLTVVLPFPRFMFNAMELMGRYSAGAALPLVKKLRGGKLDSAKDFRAVGENIVGAAALYAAYQYRTSEDAPAKYQELRAEDGTVVDVGPQFPMKQFMYLAEAYKQYDSGNWENFDPDLKEMSETFLGTQFKAGTTNVFLKDFRETLMGLGGVTEENRAKKVMGRFLGQYMNTFFTPLFQITEAQRAMGVRPAEFKDSKPEPSLEGGFGSEFKRSLAQRGFIAPSKEDIEYITPEQEKEQVSKRVDALLDERNAIKENESPKEYEERPKMSYKRAEEIVKNRMRRENPPDREFLFNKDAKRIGIMSKLITGIGRKEEDSEDGEYLTSIGAKDYLIGSKSDSPTVRNFENKIYRMQLFSVVFKAKRAQQRALDSYDSQSKAFKDKYDKIEAGVDAAQLSVERDMQDIKAKIQTGAMGKATPLVRKIIDYRKLDKTQRAEGNKLFLKRYNREPILSNITDLTRLITYGKKVK